ncbi:TPA: glycosyl transferase, partial [Citrobacter freundii]|nr:glycosyl transferase [Citrobacter freundii]
METFFNKITGIYVSKNNYLMHVYRLVEKIQHYNKVVLNIHPDDISAVISCGIAKKNNPKLKVFFVNHADHTFSFGQTIADLWFELSEFGRRIDVLRNLKTEKSFLGIPLDIAIIDNEKHFQTSGISNGDLLVTAAAGFKYKPIRN